MNSPDSPSTTMLFIIVTVVIWLGYEGYVLYYKKETISEGMHSLSHVHPMILIVIGVLLGHWFW